MPFSRGHRPHHVLGCLARILYVAVTDTTGPNQPVGKQSRNPSGIFYTPSSGIWQTVWLEPVPDVAIDDIMLTPDVQAGTLAIEVHSRQGM